MESDFTSAIETTLLETFPPSVPYGVDELKQSDMHVMVRGYLVQDLLSRAEKAADACIASVGHSLPSPLARGAAHADVAETLANHLKYSVKEWPDVLNNAVSWTSEYLVRPCEAVVSAAFGETKKASGGHIRHTLGFFNAYSYLHTAIAEYIDRKRDDPFDRDAFSDAIRKVDRVLTRDYRTADWLVLLEPLAQFCSVGVSRSRPAIPADWLSIFFVQKNNLDAARRITTFADTSREPLITLSGLARLLDGASPEVSMSKRPAGDHHGAAAGASSPSINESVPRWKRFQQDAGGAAKPVIKVEAQREAESAGAVRAKEAPAPDQQDQDQAVPIWQQFRGSRLPGPADDDLAKLEAAALAGLHPTDRERFVKYLFRDSESEYRRVLRHLVDASSWSQASRIIAEHVFRKHKVDIYSAAAVTFTNAVEARFDTARTS